MRSNNFLTTPPVVKNLLAINALMFLAVEFLPGDMSYQILDKLSLYFVKSEKFMPHQLITHMFLHGSFTHLFFNMFAVWMFGRVLEYDLGSKRFLLFYLASGVGAALIHMGASWIDYMRIVDVVGENSPYVAQFLNIKTLGASGAVFAILMGFGMMHPNSVIMLLFPPIPLKAKWFVIIYGLFELYAGVWGKADGIAHFAHLGGMIFGFLLLWYWKKKRTIYF